MYIHFDSWQEKYKKPFGAIKVGRPVEFMLEAEWKIRVQGVIMQPMSREKVVCISIISNW